MISLRQALADRDAISAHDYDLAGICGPAYADCIASYGLLTVDFADLINKVHDSKKNLQSENGNYGIDIEGSHDMYVQFIEPMLNFLAVACRDLHHAFGIRAARDNRFYLNTAEAVATDGFFEAFKIKVFEKIQAKAIKFSAYEIIEEGTKFDAEGCVSSTSSESLFKGLYWANDNVGIRKLEAFLTADTEFNVDEGELTLWGDALEEENAIVGCEP